MSLGDCTDKGSWQNGDRPPRGGRQELGMISACLSVVGRAGGGSGVHWQHWALWVDGQGWVSRWGTSAVLLEPLAWSCWALRRRSQGEMKARKRCPLPLAPVIYRPSSYYFNLRLKPFHDVNIEYFITCQHVYMPSERPQRLTAVTSSFILYASQWSMNNWKHGWVKSCIFNPTELKWAVNYLKVKRMAEHHPRILIYYRLLFNWP